MTRAKASHTDPFAPIAPHYDTLMASVPYTRWADYITTLAGLARHPIWPGAKILDLATGTGSVALEFAARGCFVTAIDRSEPMLAQARQKAAQHGFNVRFLRRDLCDFELPPEYDYALCVYDSLNYILDRDELKRAFANVRRALTPQGLLIFDVNTVQALEAELFTQEGAPSAGKIEYRWKSRYDRKTGISRIQMRFRIPTTGQQFTVVHRQRAYPDADLRSLLSQAGLPHVTAYDAYTTSPPRPESDRVFYVARADRPTPE